MSIGIEVFKIDINVINHLHDEDETRWFDPIHCFDDEMHEEDYDDDGEEYYGEEYSWDEADWEDELTSAEAQNELWFKKYCSGKDC